MEFKNMMCLAVGGFMLIAVAAYIGAFFRSIKDELDTQHRKNRPIIEEEDEVLLPLELGRPHVDGRSAMRWTSPPSGELGAMNNVYNQLAQNYTQYSPQTFQHQPGSENTGYETDTNDEWIYDQGQRWRL